MCFYPRTDKGQCWWQICSENTFTFGSKMITELFSWELSRSAHSFSLQGSVVHTFHIEKNPICPRDIVMSCYYCPAVHNGHSVQQNESEKQPPCYCWKQTNKKGFFFFFFPLLKTDQEELPHDGNKDLIILTKERLWCAFRIKTPCTKSAIGWHKEQHKVAAQQWRGPELHGHTV